MDPFNYVVWQAWRFSYPKLPLHLLMGLVCRQSLLFALWFNDIGNLLTKQLVDQVYTLGKLKICNRKIYGQCNDLVQYYSPLLMCVTYTGFDPTRHDWLYSWFPARCVATVFDSFQAPIHTLGFSVGSNGVRVALSYLIQDDHNGLHLYLYLNYCHVYAQTVISRNGILFSFTQWSN